MHTHDMPKIPADLVNLRGDEFVRSDRQFTIEQPLESPVIAHGDRSSGMTLALCCVTILLNISFIFRQNPRRQKMRRPFFGLACCVIAVPLAATFHSSAQQKVPLPDTTGSGDVDPKMPLFVSSAKQCDDCARSCEMSVAQCTQLVAGGNKDFLLALKVCQDCAAICTATARILAKDGPLADVICPSCADACKRCALLCDKSDDPLLKKCADDCRKCERVCRDMPKPLRAPDK
jgi:hypothetical protein